MKKLLTYTIHTNQKQQTVDQFLRSMGYSRHLISHLKKTPMGISIDGKLIYTTHTLKAGETLCIRLIEETTSSHILPVPMPLSILYEDDDIMIINKMAGVPVHPSQGNHQNTLANGVAYYYQQQGKPFVYRAVNRLDRDTTGLLILAKHMLSACILSDMVMNRTIHREYLAITDGQPDKDGTITAPIARKADSIIERCVDPCLGEPACTHYHLIKFYPKSGCSLVRVTLETGRTHQIRVHMKDIGHPIPGDFLYHPDFRLIKRQALHSWTLDFKHPLTGEPLHFEAPLPEDMQMALSNHSTSGI